ncbi:BglG family transcription antiterminator [Lacticaseibacillus zeae]|uniref:BglG family transcription antiterminator n=1 Tax=Lacticaseibacillus zeae TaxID=57037 RepID=A0A5R8LYE9_LACZE|nr:PTS sugar transporter subunit IIA [Lacticaseibacillus zeae]TLF42397.1 BglG family transcription antiterminator [Lacticaseibacillus zeae]
MNKRQVDLFNYLCGAKDYVPAKVLAQQYQVSSKTIYKDIDDITEAVSDSNIQIQKKPRAGIKVSGSDKDKVKAMNIIASLQERQSDEIGTSPAERRAVMVKAILLQGRQQTLKQLSEHWLVSKTSILNDIAWINDIIAINSPGIESDGISLEFKSNEEQRQTAVTTFVVDNTDVKLLSSDNYLKQFFDPKVIRTLSDYFVKNQTEWFENVPAYYRFALQILTLVQTTRAALGHHIQLRSSQNDYETSLSGDSAEVAANLFKVISKQLQITFTQGDLDWLARNLSAYRIGPIANGISAQWEATVQEMITRMESLQEVKIPGRKLLRHQLMFHLPAMVLRLQKGLIVRNPLLGDIKSQYPELFGMTCYAMSFLEDRYRIELNDDEVSFVTIYFHIAINQVITSRNVLIVFNQHGELRDYVKSQIRMLLPQNTKYTTASLRSFSQIDLTRIGLIVGVNLKSLITSVPFVGISPLFDANDQTKLMKAYADALVKPQSSQGTVHFPILRRSIDPALVFWKERMPNKQDALNFLIDQLEAAGKVNTEFRSSIFRRERLGTTELDSGAALPHAVPNTVKSLGIAFLILKKPVHWNSIPVSIVVLACVPEAQVNIYRDLVMDIYRLVQNRQMVQMIVGLNNTDQFLNLINQ